ncbi:MAG: hypothetical protein HC851_06065 [Acaryochloris sp. RU_4_1]|nr:hypothetical protein [Acaryochloris sp. RU_4_1]
MAAQPILKSDTFLSVTLRVYTPQLHALKGLQHESPYKSKKIVRKSVLKL